MILRDKFLYFIILFIGFQQFPVLRIGGSLKIYEILSIFYMFICILTYYIPKHSNITKILLLLFVISPILSYLYSMIILGYPYFFYSHYPGSEEKFKFNFYIYPILQLGYMLFNFYVFNGIISSKYILKNFNKVIKYSIYIGTIISLYSLFAIFVVDVIPLLPDYIQAKKLYIGRSNGFSQEPSFYVLYQGWIVLFVFYFKKLFRGNNVLWLIVLFINVLSLILTLSSMLLAFIFAILLVYLLMLKIRITKRMKFILLSFLAITILYVIITSLDQQGYFYRLLVNKVDNFVFQENIQTQDSGGFRKYTSRIGINIWKDHPLFGVGVGNSIYYMHIYEYKMGILYWGETLFAGIFPPNVYSLVLAEQGLIGFLALMLLLVSIGILFYKNRNQDSYCRMFLIGFIFNVIVMVTIAPQYSLFIWVFIALGVCYVSRVNIKT